VVRLVRDDECYEALGDGARPAFVEDEHPDGAHVSLGAFRSPCDAGGVWNRRTGALVWAPPETSSLCWLPGGREIILVRERRPEGREVVDDAPIGDAVFAGERTFTVELLTGEHRRLTIGAPLEPGPGPA
jgi:hypothetical protein